VWWEGDNTWGSHPHEGGFAKKHYSQSSAAILSVVMARKQGMKSLLLGKAENNHPLQTSSMDFTHNTPFATNFWREIRCT
jgi:hypothetical protein